MSLSLLNPDRVGFPPAEQALDEPNGLLAVGGAMSPEWLIHAYQHGIFPWFEAGQPILWWSPDPRMVLFPDELHVSHSLQKLARKHPYRITLDRDFLAVINACSEPRRHASGTWISPQLKQAYYQLHTLGIAHSVEVWDDKRLAGGLYGVALGKVFFGESMFSRSSNCSKLALVFIVQHLRKWGFELIDCQVATNHLASLGAREIPRREFLELLNRYVGDRREPVFWDSSPVAFEERATHSDKS